MNNSTQRFGNRVTDYIKYRPSYPNALMAYLAEEVGVNATAVVADIGSGTGIFTSLLLAQTQQVYAIEPNDGMRQAAETLLAGAPNWQSLRGSAEATGLPTASVDVVTMAQAFHWVDRDRAIPEFQRILKPRGKVVLVWNNRLMDTPFLRTYEALLQAHGTDYTEINHQNLRRADLQACFEGPLTKRLFTNQQLFDYAGLKGRAMSSSYVPAAGTAAFEAFEQALYVAFSTHQRGGKVAFNYDAEVYWGEVKAK
ncbi:MAG: class I SAM-dependent methyltransferase [Neisseriaceae bacterium]|nr:class I SAM-dependent methyltransferase [Neisseriaceae bacterium]MBP6863153.1 class I SAM-dependent methyltransferase [Neisseriaceae bacterium]